jgi:hypothetical protein
MTNPSFFPVRINDYVAAMQYSSDVNYNAGTRVSFGVPAAANATLVANAFSIAIATSADLTAIAQFPETYGRNVTLVASGASTASITLNGWDYLGQPISEQFTLNGATPVVGNKAFKTFRSVTVNTITAATTINIGSGAKFGLPYKAVRAAYEMTAGLSAAAGALQNPSLVDPATAITTDPRGMYTPTTTPNGTADISAVFDFVNDVNAAGRGGLHGLPQFTN